MGEDRKKIYMWILVIAIAGAIGAIWIASIKYNISTSIISIKTSKDKGTESFDALRESFERQIEDTKAFFETIPSATSTTSTAGVATSTNTTTTKE